jgi:hypothetical protein
MASTKNANYLALELAAPFLCPRIGALAATCKELRTASLSTITWTPFFRRRWPCLAAIEHFAAPADAHALVKGLLPGAPLLEDDTACPRDAAGRALPLRRDMILAVQLSMRRTGRAVAHGAARLSEIDLHEGLSRNYVEENEIKDWIFEFPIDQLTIDYDVADGRPGLATAAWLPREIAILPQHFLVALESHADAEPEEFGDPDAVIGRHLLEIFCREADANLLYEIYVVAGDDIWSFSRKENDGEHDPMEAEGYYNDHFKQPLQGWHAGHPPTHDDHLPWFPLVREKNFSWTQARWTLGSYTNVGGLAEMMESMSVKYDGYVGLQFCAWWTHMYINSELPRFEDAAAADAAEHEHLCRILATNRPIRFPRRQQAAS